MCNCRSTAAVVRIVTKSGTKQRHFIAITNFIVCSPIQWVTWFGIIKKRVINSTCLGEQHCAGKSTENNWKNCNFTFMREEKIQNKCCGREWNFNPSWPVLKVFEFPQQFYLERGNSSTFSHHSNSAQIIADVVANLSVSATVGFSAEWMTADLKVTTGGRSARDWENEGWRIRNEKAPLRWKGSPCRSLAANSSLAPASPWNLLT